MIDQRRNLGVGIDLDKTAAKLLAFTYIDQPGVILGVAKALLQQFFQHDGDFLAVGRSQRVQLQGMVADWQLAFELGAGSGSIDVGEAVIVLGLPCPDLGWNVRISHYCYLESWVVDRSLAGQ